MFDHSHYVPVLRWKQAEQHALRDLFPWVKSKLTPLIEAPEWGPKSSGPLLKYPASLLKMWGTAPFFFDFGPFSSGISADTLEEFFAESMSRGLSMIPTVGLASNAVLLDAVANENKEDGQEVCIRLYRDDINRSDLNAALEELLDRLRFQESAVNLLIDLKVHQPSDSVLAPLLFQIPKITKWRTLTVVSGSFRENLTGVPVGRHEFPRNEWTAWFTSVKNHALPRKPTFGDYAIFHPKLVKPKPNLNVSASIRYTSFDYWVVMKGEGLRNKSGAGFAQYPANADLLMMQPEFCGAWFSPGDRYISEIALKKKPTGNPKTWLQAGISHHLAFTTDQMTRMFVSLRG